MTSRLRLDGPFYPSACLCLLTFPLSPPPVFFNDLGRRGEQAFRAWLTLQAAASEREPGVNQEWGRVEQDSKDSGEFLIKCTECKTG